MLGLALSGGGIKASAHIGVLKALEEENITIDMISGASSGSIVATLFAIGYKPIEILEAFRKYAKSIRYCSLDNILKLLYGLTFERKINVAGLNDGDLIETEINKLCNEKGISLIGDIKTPLIIPAVSLNNGKVFMFSSKENNAIRSYKNDIIYRYDIPIGKCVRASCSFPGVFEPVLIDGNQLTDGGVRENTPWKELKEIGADKVICIAFEEDIDENKIYTNFIDVIENSLGIMRYELENYELYKANYVIKIKTEKISLLDTNKIDELYRLGYKEAKKHIHRLKQMISEREH